MRRGKILPALAPMAFLLACRTCAGFARVWQAAVALPTLRTLHRLTSLADFPALELLAAGLAALALSALVARRTRRMAALLAAVLAGYALLWYPAYWAAPARQLPAPEAVRLDRVCANLINRLNREPFPLLSPQEAAARAGGVAGLPRARAKLARWPGWMRALHISGLFSPWTGEAIVDPGAPPALVPFTAVHELMHLTGIADEGSANIAAYRRCVAAGGAFAASARLWALKYALSLLHRLDPAACLRVMERVDGDLAALCRPAARVPSPLDGLCAALGIGEAASSYDALAAWLAAQPAGASIPEKVL